MAKIRDYNELAKDILESVGGQDNITSFTHCATRLRLVLKDIPEHAQEHVKSLPGVITVVISSGQFQVVIGTHVVDVYRALSGLVDTSKMESGDTPKKSILNAVIESMSAIFAPFVYILASAGLLQGALILSKLAFPAFADTGTYQVLNFMSWTPFTFLPIFIAITAARYFKCNVYISVLCCCALVNPSWTTMAHAIADGQTITFLGIALAKTVYTSSVLPPIFLVWVLSYVERYVEKLLPNVVSNLFSPLICMLIMVPLTLLLIGPATTDVATWIAQGYNWLFDAFPPLAAAVIGGVWQIIVIFGVHWGITPVVFANYDVYGHDSFQAYQTMAVIAQMAAAFAVGLKSRNKEFKTTALSAGFTGIFGITEPAIYGVTLRLKKPFICGCVGGAVAAVVTSLFGSYYYAFAGLPGLLTVVNAISPDNELSFIGELVGAAVAIIVPMALVYMVGFDDPKPASAKVSAPSEPMTTPETTMPAQPAAPAAPEASMASTATSANTLLAPVSGQTVPLEQVNDPTFAQKLLGDGIAIYPDQGVVCAPCDGTVASVVDSQHAVALTTPEEAELLIHVGLDTVKLKGEHFQCLVKVGQRVTAGEELIKFDLPKVKDAGYDVTCPVLVLNSDEHPVSLLTEGTVSQGTPLVQLG